MGHLAFTDHWGVAVDAYVGHGKGRHRAALNVGNCLTYAISGLAGEPLFCAGEDCTQTVLMLVGR